MIFRILFAGPILLSLILALSACEPSPVTLLSSSNVKPGRLAAAHDLMDGGFENGLGSWHSCSNYKAVASNDGTAGAAVELPSQSCIYQTVMADEQNTFKLSCQTKRTGNGWAALTIAYLDENYHTLQQEEVQIRSNEYHLTSLSLNAREDAAFVEALAYTNGAGLLLDECSLETTTAQPGILSNPMQDSGFPSLVDLQQQQSFAYDDKDVGGDEIDWREAWMVHNDQGVFLAWDTYKEFPSHTWGLGVYLDTDRNRSTGFTGFYDEFPIGVDYLIEGVEQFRYTGNGTDWSWELTVMASSDIQYLDRANTGALEQIDLFFLANSAAVGGKSLDYYPDAVTDNTAVSATRYFTYDASTDQIEPPVVLPPEPMVVTPPVVTPPVVTPEPVATPIAKLDVQMNLEGHESWSVTDASNFPSQILTRNTGNVPLTNVAVNSSLGEACIYSYPTLEPGESRLEICRTPQGNSHYQHAIGVATDPDGQEVRDDDSTTIQTATLFARNLLSVTAEKLIVNSGDTVTFDIQVASSGREPANRVTRIESTIPACSKEFAVPVALDSIEAYQCSVAVNVLPLNAEFRAVSADASISKTVTIVEEGVPTLSAVVLPGSITVDLWRVNVSVGNIGAVDISDVNISGQSMQCNPSASTPVRTEIPVGERSNLYYCSGMINNRGEVADTSLIVTGTTPDGQAFETVIESELTATRDSASLALSLADSSSNVIEGAAGETVAVNFTLHNRGYFDTSEINLTDFVSLVSHPEYSTAQRYNPNAVVPPAVSVENCASVVNSTFGQTGYILAPGADVDFQCDITIPPSNIYLSAVAKYNTPITLWNGGNSRSPSIGYFRLAPVKLDTDHLIEVGRYEPVADDGVPNASITTSRVTQLMQNPDFETVGIDGMPTGWVGGCTEGATAIGGYSGNAIGLRATSCATYVLDSNEMAQLSGHEFTLGCEIADHTRTRKSSLQYVSATISLNGTESTAASEIAQGYLHVTANAPASVTEGYISLYSNNNVEIDNCQLILNGLTSSNASIKVSNHFDGVDVYNRANPINFLVTVTNDGDTDLQNIEVSSNRLACDRSYTSLPAGGTREFMCENNSLPFKQWDERVAHLITATAESPVGVVADADFSGYGNSYTIDNDAFRVTVNSQPQDAISPVAIGSDVEIQIDLVQRKHERISQVAGTLPACERRISPNVSPGDYVRYVCTIENIQENTDVHLAPLSVGQTYSEAGIGILTGGNGIFTIEVTP